MSEFHNSENNPEQLFIEKLKSCGYPEDSIIIPQHNRELPGDIVIKNGKRYVQAFEIKKTDNSKIRKKYFSQYVGTCNIKLPVYYVTQKEDSFAIYDNDALCPLDENEVLNYEKATNDFVQKAKIETSKKHIWFYVVCLLLLLLFLPAYIAYLIKSMCDFSYVWGTVTFAIIISATSIIPFANKFSVNIGDLGLDFFFGQEKNKKTVDE